jgi:hypothetical protein
MTLTLGLLLEVSVSEDFPRSSAKYRTVHVVHILEYIARERSFGTVWPLGSHIPCQGSVGHPLSWGKRGGNVKYLVPYIVLVFYSVLCSQASLIGRRSATISGTISAYDRNTWFRPRMMNSYVQLLRPYIRLPANRFWCVFLIEYVY